MCSHRVARVKISPGFLVIVIGLLYLDRDVGLMPGALIACAIHELGHVVAGAVIGGRVSTLSLTVVGAELRLEYPGVLSYLEEIFLALAGPVANLLFALIAWWADRWIIAALSAGIGLFNLLPVLPMDGGRILSNILAANVSFLWNERICAAASGVSIGALLGIGLVAASEYANVTLLVTSLWLLQRFFCVSSDESRIK